MKMSIIKPPNRSQLPPLFPINISYEKYQNKKYRSRHADSKYLPALIIIRPQFIHNLQRKTEQQLHNFPIANCKIFKIKKVAHFLLDMSMLLNYINIQ